MCSGFVSCIWSVELLYMKLVTAVPCHCCSVLYQWLVAIKLVAAIFRLVGTALVPSSAANYHPGYLLHAGCRASAVGR